MRIEILNNKNANKVLILALFFLAFVGLVMFIASIWGLLTGNPVTCFDN